MDEINIPDDLSGLSGDELRELLSKINDAGKQIAADARDADGDDQKELLKTLDELKEQKARVVAAIDDADKAAEETEEAITAAEAEFTDPDPEDEDDDDDEDADADGDGDGDGEEAEANADADREPVAATTNKGAKFSVPKRRRQSASRNIPDDTSSGDRRGATFRSGGNNLDTLEALQRQMEIATRQSGLSENGRAMLARFNRLPEGSPELRQDRSAWDNTRIALASQVLGADLLTAAGGFCGPAEAVTDIVRCGRTDTPVGDLLAKFGARGKYHYIHQVGLDDVFNDGTQYYTEEDDLETDPPVTKTCYTLACETDVEARPIFIPACFQYGVGQAWSNPEQVAAALAKFDVALARRSDALVLQRIHEQSNQLTYAPPVGESLTNGLIRLVAELLAWAGYNGRNDLDGYVLVIPDALLLMILVDSKIKAWVGPQLTREQIIASIEDLGVRVVTTPDVRALAPVGPIDALPAAPAPAGGANEKVHTWQELLLFKPEDFKHGLTEVDVAVQTDITTARANNRHVFLETIESTEKFGCSPSFSTLYNCLNPTGAQPDLVAADDTYNECPEPDAYVFPGATI